jgi:hypothetical protein
MVDITLGALKAVYQKRKGTCAVTGWIPMHVFNVLEEDIRKEMRPAGMRIHYRGPRKSNQGMFLNRASRTRRCDATHAVIYYK